MSDRATHKHVRRRPPPTTGDLTPSTHLGLPPTQRGRVTRLWTRPPAGPYAAGRRCERGRVEFDGRRARRLRTPRPRCRHQPGQPSVNRKRQIAPLSVRGDWPGCHSDALSIPSLGFAVAGFANGGPASPRLLRDLRRHILAHDAGLQQTDAVPDTYTIALRTAESVVGPTTPGRVSCTSNDRPPTGSSGCVSNPTPRAGPLPTATGTRHHPRAARLAPLDHQRPEIGRTWSSGRHPARPRRRRHGHPLEPPTLPTPPQPPEHDTLGQSRGGIKQHSSSATTGGGRRCGSRCSVWISDIRKRVRAAPLGRVGQSDLVRTSTAVHEARRWRGPAIATRRARRDSVLATHS